MLCVVIGVTYSTFIPSADVSQMILLVPALILMFLSGVFMPFWAVPSSQRTLSKFFLLIT
ncbi:ABC superfamily ATP-binding cassette transporter [Bombiscardovia coagulans]|uniref:ABC superfamily ATP-binding cassette transporter n=1 Tax=Bombiscardovia coagulans TaxID=686666 RepID=A0A261EPJ2_9BIFI|nr:ABC superfamily ATP-binding cassette transporter [Bombiscardovia coagulans]